nr:MAG TPA: hypothetical protein [Caudoviricetes sp.]
MSVVFPVYAGVILLRLQFPLTHQRVPRVCGGDPL